MQRRSDPSSGHERRPLDVVLDGAIFGVSSVYPSQRAGIWRFLRDWTRELASREDVSLHLVSNGRAPWNELALEHALRADPFFGDLEHRWHPRSGRFASWRRLQSRMASFALRRAAPRIRPTTMAGLLQALQPGLGNHPTSLPPRGVYHSPYHALPRRGSRLDAPGRIRSITLHDLIPVIHPEWFGDTRPFRRALESIGPEDHLFAVSSSTRDDAIRLLGVAPDKVHVAPPGISEGFSPRSRAESRERASRLGIPQGRYLLCLGTLEPRKNLPSLLRAFARLAEEPGGQDLHLVLVGARGWKNDLLDRTLGDLGTAGARVVRTGYLAEGELPFLFGACEAFVFPSLYEGFGLPIVEAQACGAAVVCVDNSSQPEVAGDAALLARDGSPAALEEALRRILSGGEAESLRCRGPANAARFPWSGCLDVHVGTWREALDASRAGVA